MDMYLLYVQNEDADIIFTAVSAVPEALMARAEQLYDGWDMGTPWQGFAIDRDSVWVTDQADCEWFIEKTDLV